MFRLFPVRMYDERQMGWITHDWLDRQAGFFVEHFPRFMSAAVVFLPC